jgi:hypothetical protein
MGKSSKFFGQNASGSVAIIFGLSAVALVGAVGLGVDIYRIQNTQTGLLRVADAMCAQISSASTINYKSSSDVLAMANRYAEGELNSNSATSGATVNAVDTGTSYSIGISKNVPSTFAAVVGFKGANANAQTQCSKATTTTPYACTKPSYIYASNNVAGKTLTISDLSKLSQASGATKFVVSSAKLDASNATTLLSRSVISSDYTIPATTSADTTVFVHDVNVDGSLPQFCEDALVYSSSTSTSSSSTSTTTSSAAYCSASSYLRSARTETMSNSKFDETVSLSPTTGMPNITTFTLNTPLMNGATSGPYSVPFNVSKGFAPSGSTVNVTGVNGRIFNVSVEEAYLFSVAAGKFGSMMTNVVGAGWKLVYVKSHTDAVWEDLNGACNDISSPLAIDLVGLGRIETTGESTAVDAVRHKVGRTVVFKTPEGPTKIEWLTGNGQGFLVDNRDGHAEADMNFGRLFGPTDSTSDGFETLAKWDHSGSGLVSGRDLDGLAVWIDNGDAVAQQGEIVPLKKLGVTAIATNWNKVIDRDGSMKMQSYALRDGKPLLVEDIWLATDQGALKQKASLDSEK